ncbi:ABC transporter permease [Actinomyces israelii]|jgi:ABC superfamily ATP binding cassette transporter ABC protein|uniref:ABC transporter permease n=1 Tax=Actinomyces israelii TaxID=1659 RepID=UPI002356BB67|nr:ABC transporter permease [Actinomyces israelii]
MTTTNPPSPAAPTGARHPLAAHRPQRPGSGPAIAAALSRSSLTAFVREPVAFIMTIFYPLLMLLIFGAVFRNDVVPGVSYADYMLPAMISTGTIMCCLLTLAIAVAGERESGELRRLAVLPAPTWAYVAGKCVYNTILAVISALLLLVAGRLALGASLPADGRSWGLFIGGLVLTVAAYTPLGLALGRLSPSPGAAVGALLLAIMLFQFVSGLLLPLSMLPTWMVHGFSVFPVRWSAGLMRQAFLPDFFAATDPTGSWETGKGLAVIGAWIVGGVVLAFIVARRDPVDR